VKTLVTGGSGFLGRHLVDALRQRGDDVTVFDKGVKPGREDVAFIDADITDENAVSSAVEGKDLIIHSASIVHTKWNQVDLIRRVNIGGTENLIRAAQKHDVKKLVYVSSASVVYGGGDIANGDESLPYATKFAAPYAETKSIAEQAVLSARGLYTVALRPHTIFGPGDTRMVPAILEKARKNALKFSVGIDGKLTDFTYVSNMVDACLLAADRLGPNSKVNGQAYFVTNGQPTGFWDFVRAIIVPLGYPAPKFKIPYPLAYGAAWVRETIDTLRGGTLNSEESLSRFTIDYLCTHHYYSIAKAKRDLEYAPKVSLEEGYAKTVAALTAEGFGARSAA
jgi:sterol-4alpha-carboxylate 3-dehydrogenase (decarboxylating)